VVAVSVIVVNYNAGAHLSRCLAALAAQTHRDFEAIVADNASNDDSFAAARANCADPRFAFVANDANLGFAAANNRAAQSARGTWLALLNPDAFPEPDWLERLLEATRRHPEAAIFGSTQLQDTDPSRLDGCGDAYFAPGLPWRGGYDAPVSALPPDDAETFSACAAAALIRADVFRAMGGFDATFFCYCEDVDLGFRARLAGHRCVQARRAIVRHVGGGSSGGGATARYYGTRNLVWTFFKNMPLPLLICLAPLHLATLAALLARAAARGQGRLVGRALVDAAAGLQGILRRRTARAATMRAIARALTWNFSTYWRRAPATKPIDRRIE
jgi:N-acetylglucosaminyl-diphospho-decaprenol L-rhamnosyltransferase